MDLYCGNCRYTDNNSKEGMKCKIYNSNLTCRALKVLRLRKCKLENTKFNKTSEIKQF